MGLNANVKAGKNSDGMPTSDHAVRSPLGPRTVSLALDPSRLTPHASPLLTIVIPTLNEAPGIVSFLQPLQRLRERGVELILADGGSDDSTVVAASALVDRALTAPRGRALQMNAGAALAGGDVLLFLHADARLPDDAERLILDGLRGSGRRWGRFDVRLSGAATMLRVVEWMMNQRSRLTGVATGDQGLFVERGLFDEIGGFPAIALMEDIALSAMLKRHGLPLCLAQNVVASSRRWEKRGIWRTIALMWRLRLAYFLGAEPARLAEIYYGHSQ